MARNLFATFSLKASAVKNGFYLMGYPENCSTSRNKLCYQIQQYQYLKTDLFDENEIAREVRKDGRFYARIKDPILREQLLKGYHVPKRIKIKSLSSKDTELEKEMEDSSEDDAAEESLEEREIYLRELYRDLQMMKIPSPGCYLKYRGFRSSPPSLFTYAGR